MTANWYGSILSQMSLNKDFKVKLSIIFDICGVSDIGRWSSSIVLGIGEINDDFSISGIFSCCKELL